MALTKEDKLKAVVIPLNERVPELEEEVQKYMNIIHVPEPISVRHTRVVEEHFKDRRDTMLWRKEELRRCREGYNGMSPKMYFWFNYGWIKNLSGGKIAPNYRVCQDNYYNHILTSAQNHRGDVIIKRRRAGFSWLNAADALHDAMFRSHTTIGMNSKTEADSVELFKKVKFVYDNVPDWMRATSTASNAKMNMDFSYFTKDASGNRVRRGTQSNIVVKAPTDSAFEGWMLNKWICDEAGKIANLDQLYSYTEDTMMEETIRFGQPIIFGTVGDIGREGAGLKNKWNNADIYELDRMFFGGWMGVLTDEFGNDMVEEAVRWIVYMRHKKESLSEKEQVDFLQRYPLTVAEAFSMAEGAGVGNQSAINAQIRKLETDPVKVTTGYFRPNEELEPIWVPQKRGPIKIYEHPEPVDGLYLAGCDPADHDDLTGDVSDLSVIIRKKPIGVSPPKMVAEYTDRPKKLNDFYFQSLMLLLYYNNARMLVEREKGARMIAWFDERRYKYLLARTPTSYMRATGTVSSQIGINMNETAKKYMEGLIAEEVDEYIDFIPSIDVLTEFRMYGAQNTDRAMAYGISLILAKEDRYKPRKAGEVNKKIRPSTLKRTQGGIVYRSGTVVDDIQE